MRSLLLSSADPTDVAAAMQAGADAVVIDVPDDADPALLRPICDVIAAAGQDDARPLVFVRIGAVDAPGVDAVLATLLPAEPDGIVLGRCGGGADVQHLGTKLAVHEAELDLADGQTAVLAEIGAVARALLTLDSLVGCSPRLLALLWNAQAFATDFGTEPDAPGPAATARHLVLMAARAAEVGAIAWSTGLADDVLERASGLARREGFNAVLTDVAAQARLIADAFSA